MFNDAIDVTAFTLAGNATVTLESERTGTHYTYRVRQVPDNDKRWFVSLLTGPNNTSDYTYIGLIDRRSDRIEFRTTAKSRLPETAPPVAGFRYMWLWTRTGQMPPNMAIRHEGRCGRCGRTLTVPESLDRGIGPECAQHMGE